MTIQINETTWLNHLKAITLENASLEVVLLPERGAEIHRIRHKQTGLDYFYLRQAEIQRFESDVQAGKVGGVEGYFFTGFYTMFPNAAAEANVGGYQYESHGDIRHVAWDYHISSDNAVHLSARSRNMPLAIRRRLTLDPDHPRISVSDTLVNLAQDGDPIPYIYGLHPYHGYPLLDEGTTITVGGQIIKTLPNRHEPLTGLYDALPGGVGLAEIFNPKLNTGLRYEFDAAFMPFVWVWLHLNAPGDNVWGYVGSLLPCTNTWAGGIEKALEIGTARWLNPGESVITSWAIEII